MFWIGTFLQHKLWNNWQTKEQNNRLCLKHGDGGGDSKNPFLLKGCCLPLCKKSCHFLATVQLSCKLGVSYLVQREGRERPISPWGSMEPSATCVLWSETSYSLIWSFKDMLGKKKRKSFCMWGHIYIFTHNFKGFWLKLPDELLQRASNFHLSFITEIPEQKVVIALILN